MYGKDIIVIGGRGRGILGRVMLLNSNIPFISGDFLVDHNGFVNYVEPIKADNRLYYQQFDKPYGKNYRRSK